MSNLSSPNSEDDLKKEICKTMNRLYRRGLISALSGNVSARLPEASEFWITPSGTFKGELEPEDLVKMNLDGKVVEGFKKPSIETPFHTIIYRRRADVNAVVHSHNPITTGLALAGIEIKPVTVEAALILGRVRVVPWAFPGTDTLARLVGEHIDGTKALILMNHGVIGVGKNLLEAETIVEALEETAITQLVAYIFKREIPTIPEEEDIIQKLAGI